MLADVRRRKIMVYCLYATFILLFIGILNVCRPINAADVSQEYKNALKQAEMLSDRMNLSKRGIYEQLTSAFVAFTPEEAKYAVENLQADYKKNALEKAKLYYQDMGMSKKAVRRQLVSAIEGFTDEEADYAMENLE